MKLYPRLEEVDALALWLKSYDISATMFCEVDIPESEFKKLGTKWNLFRDELEDKFNLRMTCEPGGW